MKVIALIVLIVSTILIAGPRSTVDKVVRADTIMTVRQDTIYQIRYDTIKISKVYNDTSILVKTDSLILSGKPVLLKKK